MCLGSGDVMAGAFKVLVAPTAPLPEQFPTPRLHHGDAVTTGGCELLEVPAEDVSCDCAVQPGLAVEVRPPGKRDREPQVGARRWGTGSSLPHRHLSLGAGRRACGRQECETA